VAAVAALVGGTTVIVGVLRPVAPDISLGALYVIIVMVAALLWGLGWALAVSIASLLAFNFFILPPVHTFALADAENWAALVVYLVTAVVTSELASRLQRRAGAAERRAREAALLADLAAALLARDDLDDLAGRIEIGEDAAGRRLGEAVESLHAIARERERLEAEALEAEALRRDDLVKTAVIRSVSHDLRTPLATMQAAVERYPHDPEAWYLLGDMRYHSDRSITDREALNYFDHAIAADSDFAPAYIHAIELSYRYGAETGRRYADAYLRRDPRDFEGEGIRLAALASNTRTKPEQLKAEIDTLPERVVQKAFLAISRMPDSSEAGTHLLRRALPRAPNANSTRNVNILIANQLAMHGHIREAWPLAIANKSYLAAEIAGLGLIPADSADRLVRPFLNERNDAFLIAVPFLATIRDSTALLKAAADVEKIVNRDTSARQRAVSQYIAASLRAYAALARGDTASAVRLFDALPDSLPVNIPFDLFTRARLIGRQNPRRAIEILERHGGADLLYPARELERGRLAEKIGDKERAVDAYTFVATVWQNADVGPLRDAAKEASDALKRLDSDGRLRAQLVSGAKR